MVMEKISVVARSYGGGRACLERTSERVLGVMIPLFHILMAVVVT